MNPIADIFMEGYSAYNCGESLEDNHYNNSWSSEAKEAWQDGWLAAQDDKWTQQCVTSSGIGSE